MHKVVSDISQAEKLVIVPPDVRERLTAERESLAVKWSLYRSEEHSMMKEVRLLRDFVSHYEQFRTSRLLSRRRAKWVTPSPTEAGQLGQPFKVVFGMHCAF